MAESTTPVVGSEGAKVDERAAKEGVSRAEMLRRLVQREGLRARLLRVQPAEVLQQREGVFAAGLEGVAHRADRHLLLRANQLGELVEHPARNDLATVRIDEREEDEMTEQHAPRARQSVTRLVECNAPGGYPRGAHAAGD